jgi:hypothetical protein
MAAPAVLLTRDLAAEDNVGEEARGFSPLRAGSDDWGGRYLR